MKFSQFPASNASALRRLRYIVYDFNGFINVFHLFSLLRKRDPWSSTEGWKAAMGGVFEE
jgi:hypothetical protein